MALIDVLLTCEPLGDNVVVSVDGVEAMHELPRWSLSVRCAAGVTPAQLVHSGAVISLVDPDEGSLREVALTVVRASVGQSRGRETLVHLELSDPLWPLTQRSGYKIFQQATTEMIVSELILKAQPDTVIDKRLGGAYVTWPQRVQYGETEWAFIQRMLADDGIGLWFDYVDQKPTVVLADAIGSYTPIAKRDGDGEVPAVPYVGPDATRSGAVRGFVELSWEETLCHDRAWVRELDISQPDVYIEGRAGDGSLEYFEYPARVPDAGAALERATRRLEQLRRASLLARGVCDCVRLKPGRKLTLPCERVPMAATFSMFDASGQELCVVAMRHRYRRPTRGGEGVPYRSEVTLIPSKRADGSDHSFHRPEIIAPVMVDHLDSAVVTGPGGEEIHVDEYGRVKLRYLWDRSGVTDDQSSYWARAMQPAISAPMFLPRVGWEVAVGYLDGVPDHPFVLGRLYNATAVVPYAQPASSATTAFQSWSSPGAAQAHEIRQTDDAGREEYYVHASRDQSENVGNDATTEVGADEDNQVGGAHTSSVGGNHTLSVGGKQEISAGKEVIINVEGSNTEVIGGAELVNVTGNRGVHATAYYLEIIGAAYGIQANQINYGSSGLHARLVAGNMGVAAGLGFTESVLGARVYGVNGSRTVNAKKAYSLSVTGAFRSNSGPVTETAGGDLGVQAWSGKIDAGATTIDAGGKVSVTAKQIVIDVGTLLAATLEVGGGKLKTKGGTTEVEGDVKRMRGGKVG